MSLQVYLSLAQILLAALTQGGHTVLSTSQPGERSPEPSTAEPAQLLAAALRESTFGERETNSPRGEEVAHCHHMNTV